MEAKKKHDNWIQKRTGDEMEGKTWGKLGGCWEKKSDIDTIVNILRELKRETRKNLRCIKNKTQVGKW